MLSRIAEAYSLPLVAGGAIDQPIALSLIVLDLRAYAETKLALDRTEKDSDVPDSEYKDWVWRIQAELMAEERARRGR